MPIWDGSGSVPSWDGYGGAASPRFRDRHRGELERAGRGPVYRGTWLLVHEMSTAWAQLAKLTRIRNMLPENERPAVMAWPLPVGDVTTWMAAYRKMERHALTSVIVLDGHDKVRHARARTFFLTMVPSVMDRTFFAQDRFSYGAKAADLRACMTVGWDALEDRLLR